MQITVLSHAARTMMRTCVVHACHWTARTMQIVAHITEHVTGLKHMSSKTSPVASHNKPVSTARPAVVCVGTMAHGW